MGQQQLLLLILGIVIVGLAVVVGIQAFNQNRESSARDAMISEGMRIATDIQATRSKPAAYGGGGGEWPASLDDVYPSEEAVDGNEYNTSYGTITYTAGSGTGDSQLTLNSNVTQEEQDVVIDIPYGGTASVSSVAEGGQ